MRLPEGWFHITVDGAGGQCRDDLMKTKRALSIKPLVATTTALLKQNQMAYFEHDFLCNTAGEKNVCALGMHRHFLGRVTQQGITVGCCELFCDPSCQLPRTPDKNPI